MWGHGSLVEVFRGPQHIEQSIIVTIIPSHNSTMTKCMTSLAIAFTLSIIKHLKSKNLFRWGSVV